MTTLSLVTTAWNRPQYCIDFVLESAIRQTELPDEVVIIDDGSVIDTAKIAYEKYKDKLNIKYIYNNNPGCTTSALAYNIGIKNATKELILLCSGDIITSSDVIKTSKDALGSYIDGGYILGHPVTGLTVAGTRKFQAVDPSSWYTKEFQESLDWRPSWQLEPHGEKARWGPSDIIGPYARPEQGYPCYFCSCLSRKQFTELSGFNEDYSVMGGWDDYEFIKRMELCTTSLWSNELCFHLGHWHDTLDFYKPNHYPSWGIPALRQISTPPVITIPYTNIGKEWGIIRK